MKMYIPFGDWSGDGHDHSVDILIEAPSMEHLLKAQLRLKQQYGEHFFEGMAENYCEPFFSEDVWQALILTNYPIEPYNTYGCMDKQYDSYEELLKDNSNPECTIDFVINAFIHLLNAYGAEITTLPQSEGIPTINNWTCRGFDTVGYGCFD